uniref:Uncharacterized protein n=1 Tax=Arundo donax TaxID=35708 RepID=A0A0A9HCT5_ARUDO
MNPLLPKFSCRPRKDAAISNQRYVLVSNSYVCKHMRIRHIGGENQG